MTALTLRNRISITEICFYSPSLLCAVYLAARHGPGRNAAWVFLCIFSVIRLCGAALQLETIAHPLSIPIYTASMILQSVGISPLMLVALALLGRMLGPVRSRAAAAAAAGGNNPSPVLLKPAMLGIIRLIVVLGLVLAIVGGVEASSTFERTWKFVMGTENKVGLGLICAGYGLLVAATAAMSCYSAQIEGRERRLLLAVWLSLPFTMVRVVYGALTVFYTRNESFNLLEGSTSYFLGMAVVMEMVVVVICAGIGSTTEPMPWAEQKETLRRWLGIGRPLVESRGIASPASHDGKERVVESS